MTLQKESFFLSEDTCRWQTCFTAVLQDAFSGYGLWTMAAIHNAQANSSTHTSRKRIAREHRMHLPAAGQNSQSFLNRPEGWSIVLGNPSLRSWTPLAAPPGTILYSKSRHAVKIFAIPSPDFSHPQLCIPLHFFYPRVNLATQHPFTFGWSSFFQHFTRCTEVVTDSRLLSPLILQVQQRLLLPVIAEAACQEKVHLPVHTTWFLTLPSSALLRSAFVTINRPAETLRGRGFV